MKKTKYNIVLLLAVAFTVLLILLRVGRFFLKSEGFSGLSAIFPILLCGVLLFGFCTTAFLAAWVYQDCKKRGEDPVLWAIVVFAVTPFIGLLIYFLRRSEQKQNCPGCGHRISLRAKYCEECGKQIEEKEDPFAMRTQKMHHIHYIIAAVVSLVLMLGCTAGFVVSVAAGNGIDADVTSDERVWNTGFIIMDSSGWKNGIWKLKFKSASDGFIKEQVMKIEDAENQALYADISCGTVPEGAALILWLVQDDVAEAVDVTNLSEPLEYPLNMFENGKIRVRLQINGVEDTVLEISIH